MAPPILNLGARLGECQLHALAALAPEKGSRVPTDNYMGMVFRYRRFSYINSTMPIRVGGEMCVLSYIMYADKRSSLNNHESIN